MTKNDRYYAYIIWRTSYRHTQADVDLRPFLSEEMKTGRFGWVRESRQALLLSTNEVANKMGISTSALCSLERNELAGTCRLESLAAAAEAMDCELIYAIRPKQNRLFSEVVWERIAQETERHPWVKSRPENRKARALGFFAIEKMQEPAIRRAQHWTERKNTPN